MIDEITPRESLVEEKIMKPVTSLRPRAWAALVAMALLVGGAAQGARADEGADWVAVTALRKQIGDETFRNRPAEAVAQLQKFGSMGKCVG